MPMLYRVLYEEIGEIEDEDLDQLIDLLEEESDEDQDYFIDTETLDFLAERGVKPAVIDLLRPAVGDEGAEIRWEWDEDAEDEEDSESQESSGQ